MAECLAAGFTSLEWPNPNQVGSASLSEPAAVIEEAQTSSRSGPFLQQAAPEPSVQNGHDHQAVVSDGGRDQVTVEKLVSVRGIRGRQHRATVKEDGEADAEG